MKIVEGFEAAKAILSREMPQGVMGDDQREQAVNQIISDVRDRGDAALLDYTERFDGVRLDSLIVSKEQIVGAYDKVSAELTGALELAAQRIRTFHEAQKRAIWHEVSENGLGQLMRPLQGIGVYVPGGSAVYPSTVLMTVVPAKVAGVSEVVMVTPPKQNASVSPAALVAADIAGVNHIFSVGGAQAIAALAYGTESIPAVDKICGPGNIFVALAKKAVFGAVDIDALQGPSDVLIVADDKSSPEYCAAELLAQAEHDTLAEAHIVVTSRRLADEVNQEVACQLPEISRRSIAGESLDRGVIAVVSSLDEAIELANLYAPEHLCLMVDNAAAYLDNIINVGCVVIGREATVALGDYVAGPSHALPTGGTARFSSPLNICDFIRFTSVIDVNKLDIKLLGQAASIIARAEGLDAHARVIEKRLKD